MTKQLTLLLLLFSITQSLVARVYEAPPSSSMRGNVPYISDAAMEECVKLYNKAKWLAETIDSTTPDSYSQSSIDSYNRKVNKHSQMIQSFNNDCTGKQSESAYRAAKKLNRSTPIPPPPTTKQPKINNEILNFTDIATKKLIYKSKLKLTFKKDSWISIKDATNKSLVYELKHKGEKINLLGELPIRVFLGDARGVKVTVDGKAFNLQPFINDKNIAKFTIPTNNNKSSFKKVDLKANENEILLNLAFQNDSWISAKDTTNKSLIYELIHKGEKISLLGIPPISVFLGDARGVKVTVDGKVFNLQPFINDKNIAKFTIR